jgi:trehalose 2-sulfotransferase
MNDTPSASYIICATPRSGSTLLCALLESSGVAGRPQSYFRKQDEHQWATKWGIVRSSDVGFEFTDYLQATISAGQCENGVFATRIMWGSMEEVIDELGKAFPDIADCRLKLLNRAFGCTQFIYLQRRNIVAQAVSRLRAEQTNIWHITSGAESVQPTQEPQYDFGQIQAFVQEINEHNNAWRDYALNFSTVRLGAPSLSTYNAEILSLKQFHDCVRSKQIFGI